jgi:hypothetical protein
MIENKSNRRAEAAGMHCLRSVAGDRETNGYVRKELPVKDRTGRDGVNVLKNRQSYSKEVFEL